MKVFVPNSVLASLLLLLQTTGQVVVHGQAETLTAQEFYDGMQRGRFQAVVGVRSSYEWSQGHIENATLLENLNAYDTASQVATPDDLMGCRNCSIAVYCRSGNRAGTAIRILRDAGFTGDLYNALGVSQWTGAGFPLVYTDSVDPDCRARGECCPCKADADTPAPTDPPTGTPTSIGPTPVPFNDGSGASTAAPTPTPTPVERAPMAEDDPTSGVATSRIRGPSILFYLWVAVLACRHY